MENSSANSTQNCSRDLNNPENELDICNFYIKVIKDLLYLYRPKFEDIRNSLSNIRSYKSPDVEVHEIVSFDEKNDRFAYIYAYCFIHSMVMYDRFSNLLKSNPTMLEKLISMSKIQLCILGGGPGFEIVSLCKILSTLRTQNGSNVRPLLLKVTLIDVCKGWEKDAETIISFAQTEICPPSNIKIQFQFIAADLTSPFTEEVKKALQKSHIVTMFKFLSDVNDSSYKKLEMNRMMLKIIDCMSFRACLFFLDNAGGGIFRRIDKTIDDFKETYNIYKSNPHNCHMLSIESVELVSKSLGHIFRYLKCTTQTTIACSAWLKVRHNINVDKLSSSINTMSIDNYVNEPDSPKLKSKGRKVKVKKICQSTQKLSETTILDDTVDSDSDTDT